MLPLRQDLFAEDALIFLEPRSRSLRFLAEGGPTLTLRWEGFPHLGLWAKPHPGPAFLCIEPWEGYADPEGWDGEFAAKPGSFLLPARRHPPLVPHHASTVGCRLPESRTQRTQRVRRRRRELPQRSPTTSTGQSPRSCWPRKTRNPTEDTEGAVAFVAKALLCALCGAPCPLCSCFS